MDSIERRRLLQALGAGGVALFAAARGAHAQEAARVLIHAKSSPEQVARMIRLADPRPGEVVVDLGSGEGQILVEYARAHPKIRAWGVDINATHVKTAIAWAKEQGVADRVQFFHRNAFDADLREVDIINMWVFPELSRLLRTRILAEARPGTRVVINTAAFSEEAPLGNWRPDVTDREGHAPVLLWYVPARVAGYWSWEFAVDQTRLVYDAVVYQQFQVIEGSARVGNRRESFGDTRLRGDQLAFSLDITLPEVGRTRHEYSGRVNGDQIKGSVRLAMGEGRKAELPWLARRTATSAWFRPTGVDLR
jgi:precorrin-6B methylase 2